MGSLFYRTAMKISNNANYCKKKRVAGLALAIKQIQCFIHARSYGTEVAFYPARLGDPGKRRKTNYSRRLEPKQQHTTNSIGLACWLTL